MRHLAEPGTVAVPMPAFVQLRVTNLCNLRCRMCGQWGETGIYRGEAGASPTDGAAERERIRERIGLKRQMGLDSYRSLLDEISAWKPIVSLYGGEPLLFPDIVPLVGEIKRRGMTCTMITNGWGLEEAGPGLVEAGVDAIAVSIDGSPALHDRIRGREGSFARAAAGIEAVTRARKGRGTPEPMLLAILPVTERNLTEIEPALDALRELPLDTVVLGLRWFVGKEAGAAYERVMAESFGVAGSSWKGFEFEGAEFAAANAPELEKVVRLLGTVKRRRFADAARGRPWVSFVPDVPAEGVPRYFADASQTFGHSLCPVAWYFAQVEPDGDVCFCGDFPDVVLGNVLERPLAEVWTGEKARLFREKLAKEPLPICSRCCGSWVYGKWERPAAPGARG